MKTTGPILAMGTLTVVNESVIHGKPVDWRIPIATALGAVAFGAAEKVAPQLITGMVYIGLIAVIMTRMQPDIPSPAESIVNWWQGGGKTK